MYEIEQIDLEKKVEGKNIKKIISNMSEMISNILGEKEYKGIIDILIDDFEKADLPIDITLSKISLSQYLIISNNDREGLFIKNQNNNVVLLCRNIKANSPSLKKILSYNKKSVNLTVDFFFSTILEELKTEIVSFPQDEQQLIFDYLFFRLATIDYYYNILKNSLMFIDKTGLKIGNGKKENYFLESFLEDFGNQCQKPVNWGNRRSRSSSIRKNSIKKLMKKCDKYSNVKITKMETQKAEIRKKICNIWQIFHIINKEILISGDKLESSDLKTIGIYGSSLPISLLIKIIKTATNQIDLYEYKEGIEEIFNKIENNLIKINQYDFLLLIGKHILDDDYKSLSSMEEAGIYINKKELKYLNQSLKEINQLFSYLDDFLLKEYNITHKQIISKNRISNKRNYYIATINRALENSNIEENKDKLVSYYISLDKGKKELFIKLIESKTFIIINHLDIIKYIFNKNISLDNKEKLLNKLNSENINKYKNVLFSCVENEKMEFLASIYIGYWKKVNELSILEIQKIKQICEKFIEFGIKGRITDIIDNIQKSDFFLSNIKGLHYIFEHIIYIFEEEKLEFGDIKLDTDTYISYINGEHEEYIKTLYTQLQEKKVLINKRQKLGIDIISNNKFLYIKEEFGEKKLYSIDSKIIKFMLGLEKKDIDFIIYLLMNYGIQKTNLLNIKQLENILLNKDEIEIINTTEIEDFIYNIINENSKEKIENEQEKMIFKILELCENNDKNIDLDIDIDLLYSKSKRWLYLSINILRKIGNIKKTEIVTMLALFNYNQLKNILKVYKILDGFDIEYTFYQLFLYDNLGKEQFIDEKMIKIFLEKIDKLSHRKILGNKEFVQDLINFLTIDKNIENILKKYSKNNTEEDIFSIDDGKNKKTENIINQLIKGNLSNIRLKGIVKSHPKIVEAVIQIKNLDFSRLNIKKMIIKNGFYRLKIDDIRIIFRKNKGEIYFIKIGNRENFYSNLNL